MGANKGKEDETPTSPKSPRVRPVDAASGDETPLPALLDKEASRGDETLTPKSNASVKDDGNDAASPLDASVPGRAASQRSLLPRLLSSSRRGDEEDANESRSTARTLVLKGHTHVVECLAVLDGCRLASGSRDKSVIIWNLTDNSQLAKLEGHTGAVECLAALDGGRLASGGGSYQGGELIIWNLADNTQLAKLEGHTGSVYCLAELDGNRLASGGYKSIIIWNVADGEQLARLRGHTDRVTSLAALGGGKLASGGGNPFSSDGDNSIIVWNLADAAQLVKLKGHTDWVRCLAALDGDILASGSDDNTIRIRPVLHSTAYKFAACGSAFEFEELARECREKHAIGDAVTGASS